MFFLNYLSDKVLTEGRGDPFSGVYTTVHPDSFLFLPRINADLEHKFIYTVKHFMSVQLAN